MKRLAAPILMTLLLAAGCLPAPGPVLDGPWKGCVVSPDGTTIDCDYRPIEWGEGTPDARASPPTDPGPIVVPEPIEPRPLPPPRPFPRPTPPDPGDPEPTDPPDPLPTPGKPGWGHGDPNHTHTGPPGLDRR